MTTDTFDKDINLLIINFNEDLNKYNKSLTQRKRKIDLKMFYNFLIQYNFNINASYCTTNITIYNDDNPNDISYQAFVKKRNNVDIDVFNDINKKIINSIYNHIDNDKNYKYKFYNDNKYYRLIACDGTQLNFLYSLNNELKSNKHNTYTYGNLSCLFDVELKIPINYLMSNEGERQLLIKQFDSLNNNDILIADRGYYSNDLINKLNEKQINFVLRISKHNKLYIHNSDTINKTKEGSIVIENQNLILHWYKTCNNVDKDIDHLSRSINIKCNKIIELKKLIEADNIQYETIHKINKEKNKNLKISNNEKEENDNKKLINKELKQNRLEKNILKDNIQKNIDEIDLLKKELKNLYIEKAEVEKSNNSTYFIITNLKTLNITEIKEIYKKRWSVETHFKYAKELSKINSMNNKNYKYIKQNISIIQFLFLISGYIQYILNKKIKKNKMLNIRSLITLIKNKLIFHLLNNELKDKDKIIIKLLEKLFKCLIPKIISIIYKERIRKRPQKNHYNSNIS
jgi:hypothetical protein